MGPKRNLRRAANRTPHILRELSDVGVDPVALRMRRGIEGCPAVAIIADDEDELMIVEKVAERHPPPTSTHPGHSPESR